jgi:PhnB protein
MQLQPYVFYYGRCEEALEFYKTALGGTYDLQRVEGSPAAEHMPPGSGNRVMHATFHGQGFEFMASDGRDDKPIDPDAGNISLSLAASDGAEGERVFGALSAGGKVMMPLGEAFWGGRFGMLVDRFGVEWMITAP